MADDRQYRGNEKGKGADLCIISKVELRNMGHTLILEMPEDLYEPLSKRAKQAGLTPEELVSG